MKITIKDVTLSGGDSSGGAGDHSNLINRNIPDQHPISAISDLQGSLDGKINTEDLKAITTEELLAILK